MNLLPNTFTHLHGKPIPTIDLANDIPNLMVYIQAFDDATADTIAKGEPTREFGYYGSQLELFILINPTFDSNTIPNKELSRVLSGLYSDKRLREQKEIKNSLRKVW